MNFLTVYDKLEKLVLRLPESLQLPVLREIRPLKTLFLHQRAPRILLLGDRAASRGEVINLLTGAETAAPSEDHLQDGTWQLFATSKGRLRVLDARRPATVSLVRRALLGETPDLCLYLHSEPRREEETNADLEQATALLRLLEENGAKPNVLGLATGTAGPGAEEARRHLDAALHQPQRFPFFARVNGLFGPGERDRLATVLAGEIPEEAKLEFVRLAGLKQLQTELAQTVVKSTAAICGAVGTQPIPFADFPILTALQSGMVAGIMHISGRELSVKMAGEWIAAIGANIGAGLALREGARAVLKLVPLWGDLASGGIAAAGTYAIGKAATAYFIEGVSLPDAKSIFRSKPKPPKTLSGV